MHWKPPNPPGVDSTNAAASLIARRRSQRTHEHQNPQSYLPTGGIAWGLDLKGHASDTDAPRKRSAKPIRNLLPYPLLPGMTLPECGVYALREKFPWPFP